MKVIATHDKLGTSKIELFLFKILYLFSFKKAKWIKKQMITIEKDIESIKRRIIY